MIQDDNPLSYRALNEMANRVANLLAARGVRPGERVALACPNRPEFPAIYYGILKSGAVVVPLNILLKSAEFDYYRRIRRRWRCFVSRAAAACRWGGSAAGGGEGGTMPRGVYHRRSVATRGERFSAAIAEQATEFASATTLESDTAVVLYTSGTTGRAKGAELTHANLVLNALGSVRLFDGSETAPIVTGDLAAIPHFWFDGADERRVRFRRHSGAGRALRRRAGHRADATARHHLLRRGADHVLGAVECAG